MLVASLVSGSFMSEFMSFSMVGNNAEEMGNYFTSVSFWLQIVLMLVFLTVGSVMNIATINNYLLLYEKKRTNKIEVSEVWERVRATFWMYFSTLFLFMILVVAAYIVLLIPIGILGVISPFLIFFGMLFFICGIVYFFFGAALVFIIRTYEKKGFFEAVFRSFKLVKDKWWSTFGLITVLYLIAGRQLLHFSDPWVYCTGSVGFARNVGRHFSGTVFDDAGYHHSVVYTILSCPNDSYCFAERWNCLSIL